jgi:hypothetical protein
MTVLDFIALILAAGALVDLWWNSELVEDQRAYTEACAMLDSPPFWARLLTCPYCLSHWTAGLLAALLLLFSIFLPEWVSLARIPVYALAIARGSFILNGLLPDHLHYLRSDDDEEDSLLVMDGDTPDDDTDEWVDPGQRTDS